MPSRAPVRWPQLSSESLQDTPTTHRTEDLLQVEDLLQAQSQLQSLTSAVASLAGGSSLDAVLNRVVRTACELVGARCGALIVTDEHRQLTHFVAVGLDDEGIPGSDELPVVKSLLGVPVRVRGTVFGSLYLTEKSGGSEFTRADEEIAVVLAAAAGVAVQNARLREDSCRRQRWLDAEMGLGNVLMRAQRPAEPESLGCVVEAALRVSESTLAVIAVPAAGGGLCCRAGVGTDCPENGRALPASDAVMAVLETGRPAFVGAAPVLGPGMAEKLDHVLVIPLGRPGAGNGVLLLARGRGAPGYLRADVELSGQFGLRIGAALDLMNANALRQEALLFSDRDRIARDLHDLIIQRVFAAGLSIQSLHRFASDPVAHERITAVTSELDLTIHELRETIYSLRTGGRGEEA